MGNVACILGDSGDCPPHQPIVGWTVTITVTLAVMKYTLEFKAMVNPSYFFYTVKALTCADSTFSLNLE